MAEQRLGRASLSCRNVGDSHAPGNRTGHGVHATATAAHRRFRSARGPRQRLQDQLRRGVCEPCSGLDAIQESTVNVTQPPGKDAAAMCRACGACCSFSAEWPRFSLEDDAVLARIPLAFVDDERGRMRCEGDRCAALVGEVGASTSCAVYAVRPDVCRACLPGDEACQMARRRFNL